MQSNTSQGSQCPHLGEYFLLKLPRNADTASQPFCEGMHRRKDSRSVVMYYFFKWLEAIHNFFKAEGRILYYYVQYLCHYVRINSYSEILFFQPLTAWLWCCMCLHFMVKERNQHGKHRMCAMMHWGSMEMTLENVLVALHNRSEQWTARTLVCV